MNGTGTTETRTRERMRLVGVGRAGVSIVERMLVARSGMFNAAVVDTDARTLGGSQAGIRIQVGDKATRGMGTGGDPATGRKAAEAGVEQLKSVVAGAEVVLIVAGLGGGTGSGVVPELIRVTHAAGAMSLCFVSMPFRFEGSDCTARADAALEEIIAGSDVTVVVRNEDVCDPGAGDLKLKDAFEKADEALSVGAYAIWKLVSHEGLIGLGFADLHTVLKQSGDAYSLGFGWGSGAGRAEVAVRSALECPLLGQGALEKAGAMLVGIIGDAALTLKETDRIMTEVRTTTRMTSGVYMGAVVDEAAQDRLLVTIMVSQKRMMPQKLPDPSGAEKAAVGGRKANEGKQTLPMQVDLNLVSAPSDKGRFKDVAPTILDGEDLDVPTFVRRGIYVEK